MTTASHWSTGLYEATSPAQLGVRRTVTTTLYELIATLQELLATAPDDQVVPMVRRLLRAGRARMHGDMPGMSLEVGAPVQGDDLPGDWAERDRALLLLLTERLRQSGKPPWRRRDVTPPLAGRHRRQRIEHGMTAIASWGRCCLPLTGRESPRHDPRRHISGDRLLIERRPVRTRLREKREGR